MKFIKRKKHHKALNQSPGTLSYKGRKQSETTKIDVINYNSEIFNKYEFKDVTDVLNLNEAHIVSWINVNGLNNLNTIDQLGKRYNLHPLTLEDILNPMHRPKIDEFDDYIFIVFKMIHFSKDDHLIYENVSMIVGPDYVLTFQEADGDVFNDLRERIYNGKGRIRLLKSDYLMYAILDAIVDYYLIVIEAIGDRLEDLEATVFKTHTNTNETPNLIQELKQEIIKIRRSIFPFKEVVNRLEKIENNIIEEKTYTFLRDLYDHIVSVSESVETYREMIRSLMDMYMSIISNKMNEVMKVLTIMSTIFIPLTFLAGIYGMNFEYIPELHYRYSYYVLWGVMLLIFLLMLLFFRKKKWF